MKGTESSACGPCVSYLMKGGCLAEAKSIVLLDRHEVRGLLVSHLSECIGADKQERST